MGVVLLLRSAWRPWSAAGNIADWMFPRASSRRSAGTASRATWRATNVFAKVPHNCDFLTAPLGSKHCHYERVVTTIRIPRDQMSEDEGPVTPGAKRTVSWNRS